MDALRPVHMLETCASQSREVLIDFRRSVTVAFFVGWALCNAAHGVLHAEKLRPVPHGAIQFRRPTACALSHDACTLYVANRRSGTLSLINLPRSEVIGEYKLDGTAADLKLLPESEILALADSRNNELRLIDVSTVSPRITQRVSVARDPIALAVSPDGRRIAISSRWGRCISILHRNDQGPIGAPVVVSTTFEPKRLRFTLDGDLLIALDAFGGQIVAIDPEQMKAVGTETILGHNLTGLEFLSPSRMILTHQILHGDVPTTADNIAAGNVIENVFQEIEFARAGDGRVTFRPQILSELGVPSHGAGDPSGVTVAPDGRRWIALAGIGELAALTPFGVVRSRIMVGERPTQLIAAPQHDRLYVLNEFSESISIVRMSDTRVLGEISLGPHPPPGPRERGESQFYDARISRFGWFSCHSCHGDGHTNGQLADTFGDGTAGAPKRVLSLLGGRDNNPWAWNGKNRSLHDQVHQSGISTMRGRGINAKQSADLVTFLHTLAPAPACQPPESVADQELIERGRRVFTDQGCARCHVPPLTYTSDGLFDVGLEDEHGQKKFNPPSLRGVGYGRAFFHDGRATTLESVFVEFGHQLDDALPDAELEALLRFLRSL